MQRKYFILILIFIILSCTNQNKIKIEGQNRLGNDSIEYLTKNKDQDNTMISKLKKKLGEEGQMSVPDYKILCEYLINNQNEAESEEIGYLLFEYFRENKTRNDEFSAFLSQKIDKSDKEIILCNLVQIMSIDIGEENYTYEKLIKDFKVFAGSTLARKAFEQCLSNQVY